jgi:WD40 repeat protein
MNRIAMIMAFGFFALAAQMKAQYQPAPGSKWYTLETQNFYVHYATGFEEQAGYFSMLMEKIHSDLTPVMMHVPDEKTNLVLVNNWDILFGLTNFQLFNAIYYNPAQLPLGLGHYNDFDYNVLLHEYVHVLDMDITDTFWGYIRTFFGRFYSPNMMSPNWMIEGYATYLETELTPGGRGRDPYYDMYMRMAFLDGKMKGVNAFHPVSDQWPANEAPYIFGESLYRFMDKGNTSGYTIPVMMRKDYGQQTVPLFFNYNLKYYWKGRYKKLYDNWKHDMMAKYSEQRNHILKNELTAFDTLTRAGAGIWGLAWGQGDEKLYFIQQSYDAHEALMSYDFESQTVKKLTNVNTAYTSLEWDAQSQNLVFNEIEIFDKNNLHAFTSIYDVETRKKTTLPAPKRELYTATGKLKNTYTIKYNDYKTIIHKKNAMGREEILLEGTADQYFSNLAVSPDGKWLAYEAWQKGGQKDIMVMELETREVSSVTNDRAWDVSPSWSPDGHTLYFASDRSGVYNIYAVEPENGQIKQISNVLGGAFQPKVSSSGEKLAFLSYSSEGFDVSVMDNPDPKNIKPFVQNTVEVFHNPFENNMKNEGPLPNPPILSNKAYTPLRSLTKPIRLPILAFYDSTTVELGLTLSGKDLLNRHFYTLFFSYNTGLGKLNYSLKYENATLYPNFTLLAQDKTLPIWTNFDASGLDSLRYSRQKAYGMGIDVPLNKIDHSAVATIRYTYNNQGNYRPGEKVPDENMKGQYSQITLGLQFSNAKAYKRSVSFEEGLHAGLFAHKYISHAGGVYSFDLMEASLNKFQRLPWGKHHVLYGGVTTAWANSNIKDVQYIFSDSLRGYGEVQWGNRRFGSKLEYRMPLLSIEKGTRLAPFYFRKISTTFFGEYWNFNIKGSDRQIGLYGAELHTAFHIFYYLPVIFTVGYADSWEGPPIKRDMPVYFRFNFGLYLE